MVWLHSDSKACSINAVVVGTWQLSNRHGSYDSYGFSALQGSV